jgi:hypothetical protein
MVEGVGARCGAGAVAGVGVGAGALMGWPEFVAASMRFKKTNETIELNGAR